MTQHNRRTFLNSTFIAASGVGMTAGMASSAQPSLAQPSVDQKTVAQRSERIPKAKKEWPIWDETEETALVNVLNSGTWGRTSGGPRCAEFEVAFAKRHQAKYCVLTSSGTTALL
ncbi:MAG: DegT/DnrJ/EryC1/StrS family aminotransferase, partial [Pirellula sp.]